MLRDVKLAEAFAQNVVDLCDDAFPPRLDLLGATQDCFVEPEVLVHELA
jgi:hypothetical protein